MGMHYYSGSLNEAIIAEVGSCDDDNQEMANGDSQEGLRARRVKDLRC